MSRGRTKRPALILTGVGAGGTLLSAVQTWASGSVVDPLLGTHAIAAQGSAVAPAVLLVPVVAAAGAVAALISGRVLRVAAGVAVILAGVGLGVLAVRAGLDPTEALARQAVAASGRTGVLPHEAGASMWPWLAAASGLLFVAAGVLVARGGPGWGPAGERFERGGGGSSAARRSQADQPDQASTDEAGGSGLTDWDRLSRGEDPTSL